MPFTIFQNSTTAYANEVIDNFYFIAQGNRLPRGGANLEETNSVFDLGSSNYYWKQVHCNTFNINQTVSSSNLFNKILNQEDTSTSRIEITGLNGDNNNLIISIYGVPATVTSYINLHLNGNSTTVNHHSRTHFLYSAKAATYTAADSDGFLIMEAETTSSYFFYGILFSKTGCDRIMNSRSTIIQTQNTITTMRFYSGLGSHVFSNTTDTITSFVIESVNNGISYNKIEIWEF